MLPASGRRAVFTLLLCTGWLRWDSGGTFALWEALQAQKPLSLSVPTLRRWRSVACGSALGFAWLWFSCAWMWFFCMCLRFVFIHIRAGLRVCWGQRSVPSVFFSHCLPLKTYMFVYGICTMCVPGACGGQKGCSFPWNWSYRFVLGIDPGSSAGAPSSIKHWAISPALWPYFLCGRNFFYLGFTDLARLAGQWTPRIHLPLRYSCQADSSRFLMWVLCILRSCCLCS